MEWHMGCTDSDSMYVSWICVIIILGSGQFVHYHYCMFCHGLVTED